MLETFLLSFFFLYAVRVIAKSFMPSVFTLSAQLFRTVVKLLFWLLHGTTHWPTSADQRKRKGAQRFVSKR